jgi:adenine-specific DNA-methyltransferase
MAKKSTAKTVETLTHDADTSRPFEKPTSGRIAVKVINHLGDEVMKVFRVV